MNDDLTATNPAIVLIHGLWMTPRSADYALDWANEHTGRGILSTGGANQA